MLEWWTLHKDNRKIVQQQIQSLKLKIQGRGNPILSAFGITQPKSEVPTEKLVHEIINNPHQTAPTDGVVPTENHTDHTGPTQSKTRQSLVEIDAELLTLVNARDSGLVLSSDQLNRLKSLENSKDNLTKKLKRLQSLQASSKKYREKVKGKITRLIQSNPENNQIVLPKAVGRPRLEREQPGLMEAIINIVTYNSTADERRRTETLRSIKTLDQLLEALKLLGFFLYFQIFCS